MIMWEYKDKDYIIELCYRYIVIYNLFDSKLYHAFITNNMYGKYYSGFISNDNKYLYTCSSDGYINIFNLYKKINSSSILIHNGELFHIIPWSIKINSINNNKEKKKYNKINNYILVTDRRNKGFYCLNISFDIKNINQNKNINKDLDISEIDFNYKILTFYNNGKNNKCIKKIYHPIYGLSLLCSNDNKEIDLWINN